MVTVHEDFPDSQWDEYVGRHPSASAYHYSGWCRLICRAFGHEPRLLAAGSASTIRGVLPLVIMKSRLFGRFAISLPFLNAGGVIADDRDAAAALVAAAISVARDHKAAYLELRHTERLCPTLLERRHKVSMAMPLKASADAQWNALDRKVRNQIRKAERHALTAVDGGVEVLEQFYCVFSRNMRDLGTPVFGLSIFREALTTFPDNTRALVVLRGSQPVAASIVHWRNGWIEVIWASALRQANPLSANMLLYWHMLRWAIARSCHTFEFGRCTPGEGTYDFKRQWGAEPSPLVWEYWTAAGPPREDLNPRSSTFRRASELWRMLPVPLATAIGPRIARGIPC